MFARPQITIDLAEYVELLAAHEEYVKMRSDPNTDPDTLSDTLCETQDIVACFEDLCGSLATYLTHKERRFVFNAHREYTGRSITFLRPSDVEAQVKIK